MSDLCTSLVTFEQPVEPSPTVLRRLEDLYTESVLACWAEKGFENITPAESAEPCRLFTAQLGQCACLLVMPAPVAGLMALQGLSEERCEQLDREFAGLSVFYSALVLEERELLLFLPVPLRDGEQWARGDKLFAQFLPLGRRENSGGFLGALLGDGYEFKFFHALAPYLAQKGKAVHFSVRGWRLDAAPVQPCAFLRASDSLPCWLGMVLHDEENGRLTFHRPVFYHEAAPYCELELVSRSAEQADFGIVELLGPTGYRLWAESPESAAFGAELPCGRRYLWSLAMVAEACRYNTQEIRISEGSVFEFMREDYIRDHGEEPPADHVFTLSTSHMRALNQEDEDEYAASCMLIGVVEELREVRLPAGEFGIPTCLMAVVRCIPDDEDTAVSVYLPPAALGDYTPKPGDNIACMGTLLATAHELCETRESWQDSAAVAEWTEERELAAEAHGYFDACKETSLALGAAVAAFVRAGWTVEQFDPDTFNRKQVPLCVHNQYGERASVFVDTVINGHSPQFSYAAQRERIEEACRENGERCIFATVELTYKPVADRYAVSMSLSPDLEGVKTPLVMCSAGFPAALSLSDDDEEEPTSPAPLDEAAAARLLADAFATGRWAEAAKRMREEMRYTSKNNGTQLYGKTDYLRYIAERIDRWKEMGEWHNFSFAAGTLVYEGQRRPCMAMAYQGVPTGMLVFRDSHGCIGEMEAVDSALFAGFVAASPLCNYDLPAGELPVIHTPQLFRPEHGAAALPDMLTDTPFARMTEQVVRFLQQRGTPCVARHAEPELLPHLWFRETDGRLAYIVLGQAGAVPFPEELYAGYRACCDEHGGVELTPLKES